MTTFEEQAGAESKTPIDNPTLQSQRSDAPVRHINAISRERQLILSAKTKEFLTDNTVASAILGEKRGRELLRSFAQRKRIVTVVAIYVLLLTASVGCYFSNQITSIHSIHVFNMALATMICYELVLIYHLVLLYQTAVLSRLIREFTTLYLVCQVVVVQFTYAILVFQDPESSSATKILLVGGICTHGGSEIVRIFADAFPPDFQVLKLCVYFVSFVQYLIFSVAVSTYPSLFVPSQQMEEVTLQLMGKGWLVSDLLSSALWTLAIFFGKLSYYCWMSPGACGILMEQLKLEFQDESDKVRSKELSEAIENLKIEKNPIPFN